MKINSRYLALNGADVVVQHVASVSDFQFLVHLAPRGQRALSTIVQPTTGIALDWSSNAHHKARSDKASAFIISRYSERAQFRLRCSSKTLPGRKTVGTFLAQSRKRIFTHFTELPATSAQPLPDERSGRSRQCYCTACRHRHSDSVLRH